MRYNLGHKIWDISSNIGFFDEKEKHISPSPSVFACFGLSSTRLFYKSLEALPPNWNIESPIQEDMYSMTQNRGIFVGYDGLHLQRRGSYPSDTLQVQLIQTIQTYISNYKKAIENWPWLWAKKDLWVSNICRLVQLYIPKMDTYAFLGQYRLENKSHTIHLTEHKDQWSIYDKQPKTNTIRWATLDRKHWK